MAASRTPTKKESEERLILYRLEQVENAVKDVGRTVAARDNLTRSDLVEFKDAIFERFVEVKAGLEKQIEDKADKSQVDDLRALVKWGGGFATTLAGAFIVYYFTNQ